MLHASSSIGWSRNLPSFRRARPAPVQALRTGGKAGKAPSDPTGTPWLSIGGFAFALGGTLGPVLDGIHGSVGLLEYKKLAFDLGPAILPFGPIHTSAWVFLLLGTFYALAAPLVTYLDQRVLEGGSEGDAEATAAAISRASDPAFVALSYGWVASVLGLSAFLYSQDASYSQIHAALALPALASWAVLDRTKQGLALAGFIAVAAPISEVILMRLLGLWEYARPDLALLDQGLVSWVLWCYLAWSSPLVVASRSIAAASLKKE